MIRPRRILLDECMHLSHQSVFPEEFEVSHVEPEGWKGHSQWAIADHCPMKEDLK